MDARSHPSDHRPDHPATADGPADIWAIADQRQLLRWNGTRWHVARTPNLRDVVLSGLAVLGRRDAWAVGSDFQPDGSTALIEHWNGHTWRRASTPKGTPRTQLTAIAAASPNDVWAFGSYVSDNPIGIHTRSGIVTEHWDGRRWRLVRPPVYHHTKHDFTIDAATMQSQTQGWAVGDDHDLGPHVVALHWDGIRWRPTPTPGCCELLAAAATRNGGVWAAGYAVDPRGHGYRSRAEQWNGTRFVPIPAPNIGATIIDALSALPNGRVYLAGTGANATTYRTCSGRDDRWGCGAGADTHRGRRRKLGRQVGSLAGCRLAPAAASSRPRSRACATSAA
jgi:hypothetical protein